MNVSIQKAEMGDLLRGWACRNEDMAFDGGHFSGHRAFAEELLRALTGAGS